MVKAIDLLARTEIRCHRVAAATEATETNSHVILPIVKRFGGLSCIQVGPSWPARAARASGLDDSLSADLRRSP